MAYLGNNLQVAFPSYRNIDDISASFNGVTTSFPLLVSGSAPVPFPIASNQCLISVGGVVQRPDDSGTEGFRLNNGNIVFSSAPAALADFFGVILAGADYINAGGQFPAGHASAPSITFSGDPDTGFFNPGANEIAITTGGTERFRVDSAGQLEAINLGTAAAPTYTFNTDSNTGIYSPGADQVAISTNGTGRLFVDANGNVGIGGANSLGYGTSGPTLQVTPSGTPGGAVTIKTGCGYGFGNVNTRIVGEDNTGNSTITFFTGNSERLRLDSSGRLGIGTTTPATTFDLSGAYSSNVTAVAALDINCSLGNYFTKTINGNSTFTVSSVPASRSYSFTLELTHTSGTVTWFAGVVWPNSTAPTLTTGKVHLFMFVTDDGGTTWRGSSLINY